MTGLKSDPIISNLNRVHVSIVSLYEAKPRQARKDAAPEFISYLWHWIDGIVTFTTFSIDWLFNINIL